MSLWQWLASLIRSWFGADVGVYDPRAPLDDSTAPLRAELAGLIMGRRMGAGVPLVQADDGLNAFAQRWAQYTARRGIEGHGEGRSSFLVRATGAGLPSPSAEIFALGPSPEAAVADWMRSDSHRHVMLDPSFRKFGVGSSIKTNGYYHWVAVFTQ